MLLNIYLVLSISTNVFVIPRVWCIVWCCSICTPYNIILHDNMYRIEVICSSIQLLFYSTFIPFLISSSVLSSLSLFSLSPPLIHLLSSPLPSPLLFHPFPYRLSFPPLSYLLSSHLLSTPFLTSPLFSLPPLPLLASLLL